MSIRTLLLFLPLSQLSLLGGPERSRRGKQACDVGEASESMLRYVGGCMWSGSQDVAVSDGYAYLAMHQAWRCSTSAIPRPRRWRRFCSWSRNGYGACSRGQLCLPDRL